MAGNWHCYCDETCIGKPHKHMAVGGLLVRVDHAKRISAEIREWRRDNRMHREIKWDQVDRCTYDRYREFVDHRMRELKCCHTAFCAIIVERNQWNNRDYNDNSEDEGLSKLFYQFILHRFIPLMQQGDSLFIFPDKKSEKYNFGKMQSALRGGMIRKFGAPRVSVPAIRPICSKTTILGQVNDVLLGAVGFHANEKQHLASVGEPKIKMAEHIASHLELPTLATATPPFPTQFGIWRFRPQPRSAKKMALRTLAALAARPEAEPRHRAGVFGVPTRRSNCT